ncbi:AlpA family phage regulatory protein [Oxalobacter vibrioformis]|uniref:AlpA family phage regulatory protein n=2 Tax=Oxalobacter vibrioformis TaxID=933080 RepID=A0A9E9P398_9BURK|nr:AlpA family phage regulatory protein [Oxalobacter vibrioformis]WAW10782.1 AlpA family phage regulatory protein [Oxalobacter vibrioformis]
MAHQKYPGHILRLPDVRKETGLSRSTIYFWMNAGIFPRSIRLGPRAVGWLWADIHDFIRSRQETGSESRNQ